MGRPRTVVHDLPNHVHMKGPSYYFVATDGGNRLWIRLGRDREAAFAKAEELRIQYDKSPEDPGLRRAVMLRDGFACVYCQATSNLEIDHVVPLSMGGANSERNIVVACRTCNATKNAKHPKRFVDSLQKLVERS
jgi:hypothetical protein